MDVCQKIITRKRTIFISILFSFFANYSIAQECGTVTTEEEYTAARNLTVESPPLNKTNAIVKIKIFVACSGATTATAAATESDINTAIALLNTKFGPAAITFEKCDGIRYLFNCSQFNFNMAQLNNSLNELCERNNMDNTLNIYFINKTSDGTMGMKISGNKSIFIAKNDPANVQYVAGPILCHEVGHLFGLIHTGYAGTLENVARTGTRKNCDTEGDFVCDTHADPGKFIGDGGNNTCLWPNPALVIDNPCNYCDVWGEKYTPNSNNIMIIGACPYGTFNTFTTGQIDRIFSTFKKDFLNKFTGTTDLTINTNLNALMGCDGISFNTRGYCEFENPVIEMSAQEITYNPLTFSHSLSLPNTEVKRNLTSSEWSDMLKSKLNITTFTNTGGSPASSITIQANKYYLVTIVNKGNGSGWNPSYFYFHTKPGTHDYAMRDYSFSSTNKDIGIEPPDYWEDKVFNSPDLWNNVPAKNSPTVHQNPDFVTAPNTTGNNLRFNLKNIGCNTSNPSPSHTIRLFWTRARTDELWDKHWKYDMSVGGNRVLQAGGSNYVPAGSEITIQNPTASNPYNATSVPKTLQNIAPSTEYLTQAGQLGTEVAWFPPNPADFDATNGSMGYGGTSTKHPVICLLAIINDKTNTNDPVIWEPSTGTPSLPSIPIYPFVKNNNNVVTRNTIIVDDAQYLIDRNNGDWDYGFGTVWVNNDQTTIRNVTLCIDLEATILPNDFTDYGRIEVGVTNGLWSSWVSAGMNSTGMNVLSSTLFELTGTHGCISNIPVNPGSEEQIGLRFVYDGLATLPNVSQHFNYILSATYGEDRGSNSVFEVNVPTTTPLEQNLNKKQPMQKVEEAKQELIIYPNPAKNVFLVSLQLPKQTLYKLKLIDIHGKVIKEIEAMNTSEYFSHNFEMKGCSAGVYYIYLEAKNTNIQRKVILID